MKKRLYKVLLLLIGIFIVFSIYKFSNPKIVLTNENVEQEIPVKINGLIKNTTGDSILVFLPYKFKIQNNRLQRISVGDLSYKMNPLDGWERTLMFDENGYQIRNKPEIRDSQTFLLDALLDEKKYLDYFKLKNNNIVYPFSSKIVYYFKSFKMSKNILEKDISREDYWKIVRKFSEEQKENLYQKAPFSVSKKIIDSLYGQDKNNNQYFYFYKFKIPKEDSKYGYYRIKCRLADKKQYFADYYDTIRKLKTKEEVYEYLLKPEIED